MARVHLGLFLCFSLLFLSSCSQSEPPIDVSSPIKNTKAQCLHELDQLHILYDSIEDLKTPEGCKIENPVRVKQSFEIWNHSALMSCQMALDLWAFEKTIMQPIAHELFGKAIKKMNNVGAYSCRNQRSNHPEKLSEHAYGQAIDITSFELEDGTVISILNDWSGKGSKSKFLQKVAHESCKIFNVVLTPKTNSLHRDHFHFDSGSQKYCGA
jgi:hypothetical protein